MRILGIESSCDDTGIGVIENGVIIENIVVKQDHNMGVIPEIAARKHYDNIYQATKNVFKDIDLIAYTNGPGLIGSLFVGSSFAKGLSYGSKIPLFAVNHLEGHFLLPYWLYDFSFPYLTLLVSGGHTLLIEVYSALNYKVVSRSLDDAVGEVFDKVARHIGLPYPGGAEIEKYALNAVHLYHYDFPNVMHNRDEFSFSGLKTAAIRQINQDDCLEKKYDFCFQFQVHIAKILCDKFERFYYHNNIKNWVIAGGVAANQVLRAQLEVLAKKLDCSVFYPEISLCTDNGVMIACVADLQYAAVGNSSYDLLPKAASGF